jgi:hypothetical protein
MPAAIPTTAFEIDFAEAEARCALAHGGGDGIIRNDGDEGLVTEKSPVSMSVFVGPFRGYIGQHFARVASTATKGPVTAPTGGSAGNLRRIDLVQFTLGTIGVNIVTGVESSTPSAPALSANSLHLALLHLRKGMASIKDADDATNGYIVTTGRAFI